MATTEDHRTTPGKVRQRLTLDGWDTTGLEDNQLTVFIDDANMVVTEDLSETEQSDRRLEKIETYLAGHFILASDIDELRQTTSESDADGSSASYVGDYNHDDYRSTSLGQQAVNLDQSGKLADANKPTASIDVPEVR
ncbi:hypothetical protein [Haloterrigena salifodinae]|uniref:hypothetical protein n=1 Tax=Haloterrigena salifodinae TaxID=2675099 RepID=UPI000F8858E0|nr:hypothetical protein [Haloterrigena salifodinae]